MDLDLIEVDGGTRLRLRVRAGARKTAIHGPHGGALKLSVSAAPERGKANQAVLVLVARALDLSPTAVTLVSGETSPDKTVLVPLSPATVLARLSRG